MGRSALTSKGGGARSRSRSSSIGTRASLEALRWWNILAHDRSRCQVEAA
ncbi:hypothetical protein AKJ09_01580 [Labilithrix luteola]|uniref:Uncharacterized protein n=1 Tax=Labilithrix luteola TaxID=1391654 RepID=A0A0K1PNE5_9BACT|nr:hypothetical protein AKJ09_01580 [Labilithrix luteola]